MSWHVHSRTAICPVCGVSVKPSGSQMQDAMIFGGHTIPTETIEQKLAEKPPDDDAGFWDDKNFDAGFLDRFDRNVSRYMAGDLPPVVTDEQIVTLKQGIAGK